MSDLSAAPWRPEVVALCAITLLLAALLYRFLASGRDTVRHSLWFLAACGLLELVATLVARHSSDGVASGLQQAAVLGLGVVLIRLGGMALFRLLLPALRLPVPRIVEDIVVIAGYLLWLMVRLSFAGVELSGLVATSALITAVVAFAMQDTLGNMLGGLALQLDDSLEIGDWLRLDDVSGRVVEIQWRFTALRTRNGERVVIPNAQLMKAKFTVIGGHDGEGAATGWRRWIWFNIDDAVSPSQVITTAERVLSDAEIVNVASTPPPSCVAMDYLPGSVRYALRYWLIDPGDDDATDSAVRVHLLAALQRQGWRIALPDQAVHLLPQDEAHREATRQRELARRQKILAAIDLFAALDEGERTRIATRLIQAPFARGDVITRQGAVAHWLYIVASGQVEVHWTAPGGQRHLLSRLGPGSIFGEMGLLTGAPRSASVLAASDVVCYRLDKAGFEDIIHERQEVAESLSRILAQRQQQTDTLRREIAEQPAAPDGASHGLAIMQRMREFFGLG